MPLSDIVNIVITTGNPGVTQAGFGVDAILSCNATFPEGYRVYSSALGVSADFALSTPEYLAASKYFGQSPAPEEVIIGKGTAKPTMKWSIGAYAVGLSGAYKFRFAMANGSAWASQDVLYTSVGATQWLANTAYAKGDLVVNDSGPLKFYICTTAGTSAGSGGPTGTSGAITDNTVTWMYAGTGVLATASNDAIVYNLMLAITALASPIAVGGGAGQVAVSLTGSAGAKKLQILANTAGAFFGVDPYDLGLLSVAQTQADPGVAADLAALALATSDFYGVTTLYNSSAIVLAAAAWVEANQKLYPVAVQDTECATVADGSATDVAHALKALGYFRTAPFFHPGNDEFADAAETGRFFPYSPGSENWRLKTLSGVTARTYTQTHVTNLNAKYCNYYYVLAGANVIGGNGLVSGHEYIDVIRFRDWYKARLGERLANLLIRLPKLPYTDPGIAAVEAEVVAQNQEGIAAGGIAASPAPVVTVPLAASVSPADKAARILRNVNSSWTLAGAINKFDPVNVSVSV